MLSEGMTSPKQSASASLAVAWESRDFDKVEEAARRIIADTAGRPPVEVFHKLYKALVERQEFAQAEAVAREAIHHFPNSVHMPAKLAKLLLRRGEPNQALLMMVNVQQLAARLEKALPSGFDQEFTRILDALASEIESGAHEKDWARVLAAAPLIRQHLPVGVRLPRTVYLGIAKAYLALKRWDEARDCIEAGIADYPKSMDLAILHGQYFLDTEQPMAAVSALQRMVVLASQLEKPVSSVGSRLLKNAINEAWQSLNVLEETGGDWAKVIEGRRTVIDAMGEAATEEHNFALVEALRRGGDLDAAVARFELCVRDRVAHKDVRPIALRVLLALGENPGEPFYWFAAGYTHETLNLLEQSAQAYEKAVDLMPAAPALWWAKLVETRLKLALRTPSKSVLAESDWEGPLQAYAGGLRHSSGDSRWSQLLKKALGQPALWPELTRRAAQAESAAAELSGEWKWAIAAWRIAADGAKEAISADITFALMTALYRSGDAAAASVVLAKALASKNEATVCDMQTKMLFELASDQSQPLYWLAAGEIYTRRESFPQAIAAFRKALALKPDAPGAWWVKLATAYLSEKNRSDLRWDSYLGAVSSYRSDWESAIEAYRQALAREPENAHWWFELGRVFEAAKSWPEAVDSFVKAIRYVTPPVMSGAEEKRSAKTNAGAGVIEAVPMHAPAAWYYRLGLVRQRAGLFEEARAAYEIAISLEPKQSHLDRYAKVCELMKDWAHASVTHLNLWPEAGQQSDTHSPPAQKPKHAEPEFVVFGDSVRGDVTRLARALLEDREVPRREDAAETVLTLAANLPYRYPERWWLSLYGRLFQLGWIKMAYVAKFAAAQSRLNQAEIPNNLNDTVERARALALLDRHVEGGALLANFIGKTSAAHDRKRAQRIGSEYATFDPGHLHNTAFQVEDVRLNTSTAADMVFAELIGGKSVAIVGPRDPEIESGSEIDAHDVIVRFNYHSPKEIASQSRFLGSRTDISYYNISFEANNRDAILDTLKTDPIKLAVVRRPLPEDVMRAYGATCPTTVVADEFRTMYHAVGLGVPRVVYDISRLGPSKISLYNIDFYTDIGKMYHSGYRKYDEDELQLLSVHDPLQNFQIVRRLHRANAISGDELVTSILGWNESSYIETLDKQMRLIAQGT